MPFIPIHDDNPRILVTYPWVTWGLILLCAAVALIETGLEQQQLHRLVYGLGMIPASLAGKAQLPGDISLLPPAATLLSHQFLHGGMLHLVFNMAFLWVFGDNIEDAMGHWRFLVFFLLCGVLAGLAHVAADPASQTPIIGASGAVSGILGAYLVLHPKAKVLIQLIFFIPYYLPAYVLLVLWIGFQVYSATLAPPVAASGGVAWWAHIGGFLAGLVLIVPFRHKTIALWGAGDLPSGLEMTVRNRRSGDREPPRE